MIKDVVTIDPGFDGTACAYWDGTGRPEVECFTSSRFDLKKNLLSLPERIGKMCILLDEFMMTHYPVKKVYLESVDLWSGSLKSLTSAKRGDLFKLAYLVGAYIHTLSDFHIEIELLSARKWKGQLSKEATSARVKEILDCEYKNEHMIDAVAIGLSRDREIWTLKDTIKFD